MKVLAIHETSVTDLSPLARSAQLEFLDAWNVPVSDLGPLAKMPLKWLGLERTKVVNLGPLAECTTLEEIVVPTAVKDVSLLRHLPKLNRISTAGVGGGGSVVVERNAGRRSQPKDTAEDFWLEYDAKRAAGKK